jgi:hypothetical protein
MAPRRTVDKMVNNAVVLADGPFGGIAAQRHQQLIDLNVSDSSRCWRQRPGAQRRVIASFRPVPSLAS